MDEMTSLMETGEQFADTVTNLGMEDLYDLINIILRTLGFPGWFHGSASMAEVTDWLVSVVLGPFAQYYDVIANLADTAMFVDFVNQLLTPFVQ